MFPPFPFFPASARSYRTFILKPEQGKRLPCFLFFSGCRHCLYKLPLLFPPLFSLPLEAARDRFIVTVRRTVNNFSQSKSALPFLDWDQTNGPPSSSPPLGIPPAARRRQFFFFYSPLSPLSIACANAFLLNGLRSSRRAAQSTPGVLSTFLLGRVKTVIDPFPPSFPSLRREGVMTCLEACKGLCLGGSTGHPFPPQSHSQTIFLSPLPPITATAIHHFVQSGFSCASTPPLFFS